MPALIAKTAVIYLVIVISMRMMGKKIAGQLQPYELVITLMIAEVASAPLDSEDAPILSGLIPAMTLIVLCSAISLLILKSRKLRVFFCGKPSVIINNGRIMLDEMEKLSYSLSDLFEQLRTAGYPDVSKICYAVLETNGELSVLPYPSESIPTFKDLKIPCNELSLKLPLILDGDTVDFGMKELSFTDESLDKWLDMNGLGKREEIFTLLAAKDNSYFCQYKNGKAEKSAE